MNPDAALSRTPSSFLPLPFVPGFPTESTGLLARYLPALPAGVAAAYVERHTAPGDLILDPFGQSARIAVEAVQLGRRAVIVNRNPVVRFVHAVTCNPPSESLARSALTRLADAPAAGGTVEQLVRAMYRSTCPDCGREVDPEFFAWHDDNLLEKRLVCGSCGEDKVRRTEGHDVAQAARYEEHRPGYWWALDRVTPLDDPDRDYARHALDAYTPRALQAIFTLLSKLDTLDLEPDARRALHALLLFAFDEGNSLWPYPSERGRPKTLNPHQSHRERNLWLALEQGVALFGPVRPVRVVALQELLSSTEPGVAIVEGPVGELEDAIGGGEFSLALSALPRPNPVLWALSVVWAAWLWDRPASQAIRPLLRRRRYDWDWHEQALRRALPSTAPLLRPDAPVVGLLPASGHPFLAAVLTAADGAGLDLLGLAVQPDDAATQIVWRHSHAASAPALADPGAVLRPQATGGVTSTLQGRAEPSPAEVIQAAALAALAQRNAMRALLQRSPDEPLTAINAAVDAAMRAAPPLAELDPRFKATPGGRLRWLRSRSSDVAPLAEQVEQEVAGVLARHPGVTTEEVLRAVFEARPGLLTPSLQWVWQCLRSYGEELAGDRWRCRPEDMPATRAHAHEETQTYLIALGQRLAFAVEGKSAKAIRWLDGGETEFLFLVLATAAMGSILSGEAHEAANRVLVIPGSRAGMIQYRLQHDPRLQCAVDEHGWTFLKYRHVRRLAAEPDLDRTSLNSILGLDPIVEQPSAQIPLL